MTWTRPLKSGVLPGYGIGTLMDSAQIVARTAGSAEGVLIHSRSFALISVS